MSLAERIQERLDALGLTPITAATNKGYPRDLIRNVIRSDARPRYDTLIKIADALEITTGELMGQPADDPSVRLQQARAAAGFETGTDAAKANGWEVSTYLGHENGSRGLRNDVAAKYAQAFNVSAAWLLVGDGVAPDPNANRWGEKIKPPTVTLKNNRVTLNLQADVSPGVAAQILALIEGDKP